MHALMHATGKANASKAKTDEKKKKTDPQAKKNNPNAEINVVIDRRKPHLNK